MRNLASVIWMFCLKNYLKMEKSQFRVLNIIYDSNESNEELIISNNEVSVSRNHLRALATEINKSLADKNPGFMKPYFTIREIPYNLQNWSA